MGEESAIDGYAVLEEHPPGKEAVANGK